MRTIAQIIETIRSAFRSSPVLAALDIDTPTAVEYNIIAAVGQAQLAMEATWDVKREELQDAADRTQNYTGPWYQYFTTRFQYGDSLSWSPSLLKYVYATIDTNTQIVKYSAVTGENDGSVIIKAAKDVSGAAAPLTTAEAASLQAYWDILKPIGMPLSIRSVDGDLVQIYWGIYHNGLRPIADLQVDVEAAIKGYLKALEFGGILRRSDLIEAIKAVAGVVDVSPDEWLIAPANTGIAVYMGTEYRTYAGYAVIDDTTAPLGTSLYYQIATA